MDLSDASVLITGGAGLIGSHIADQLVARDVRSVVLYDSLVRGREENVRAALDAGGGRVRIVPGDIRDREALARALDGVDFVFHQAAIRINQCAEEPRLALEVLVEGTFNVLEAAVAAGVTKVVAASSASVYGMADEFPTTERHHPYNNRTLYGSAKAFNEGLLRSFNDMFGLDYVALRYFNVYGPRMDVYGAYTEVLVRWMERIEAGEPPLIHGDGSQTMDFVYATDIARANLCAAESSVTDEVYNVGTGTSTSLVELAAGLARAMGSELKPEFGPERALPAVPARKAEVTRAARDIGFTAQVDLDTGLRRLVDWWRAERAAERRGAGTAAP
jgi:UDP-glucose 4-epimerase